MSRLAAAIFVLATSVAAQQPSFKSGVDLVRIPVSLTQGDTPVEPGVLTAADFKLMENGVEQTVRLFERQSLPLSICVVFDTSGSMREDFISNFAVASFRQVLTRLLPEDEVSVIAFADRPVVVAPWTPAPALTGMAVKLHTDGATSLIDAVLRALELIETAHNPRPVVLMITDGGENSSRTALEKIVTTRRQSETQVYAFKIAPPRFSRDSRAPAAGAASAIDPNAWSALNSAANLPSVSEVLPRLIGDSGGFEYRVRTEGDTANLARAFVDDLRLQYTLGYTPLKAMDGKYRRVKVEVKKRGFRIRHRGGYLAMPSVPQ